MTTDDLSTTPRRSMSPTRRLRIWERDGGVCCICSLKIDGVREKWGIEHKRPLALGGPDTDENCGPAHERCMATKTKADNASWTKAKRAKAKHIGIKPRSSFPKKPPGYQWDWSKGPRLVKQ